MNAGTGLFSSLVLAAGLSLAACGGDETPPLEGSETSADPTTLEIHSAEAALHGRHGHGGGGDREPSVEWSCRASPIGGGPIFYGRSHPDLSAAMDYAVGECERQMGEACTQRGCGFHRDHGW